MTPKQGRALWECIYGHNPNHNLMRVVAGWERKLIDAPNVDKENERKDISKFLSDWANAIDGIDSDA